MLTDSAHPTTAPRSLHRRPWLALVSILLLGALLRLHGLERLSLWADELSTWDVARRTGLSEALAMVPDPWPPGHYILMLGATRLFGYSEFALRFPAALSGVLSLAAMFRLGRRIYGEREGLLSAGLLAVAWYPVRYGQEARAYSDIILLTLLSLSWWVIIARKLWQRATPPGSTIACYIVTSLLLLYWSYSGLLLVGLQGLVLLALSTKRWTTLRTTLLIGALIGLGFLPLLPGLLRTPLGTGQGIWYSTLDSPLKEARDLLFVMLHRSRPVIALAGLSLALYIVRRARQRRRRSEPGWGTDLLILLWLVVPPILLYAKSALTRPTFTERYLIGCFPAAYLLIARATATLWHNPQRWALVSTTLIGFMLFDLVFMTRYYERERKQQFRETAAYVIEHSTDYPDALIVVLVYDYLPRSYVFYDYYFERLGSDIRADMPGGHASDIPRLAEAVRAQNPRHIWFIVGDGHPEEAFMRYLYGHFRLIRHVAYYRAEAWLFETFPSGEP